METVFAYGNLQGRVIMQFPEDIPNGKINENIKVSQRR